jgi:ribonuclease HI
VRPISRLGIPDYGLEEPTVSQEGLFPPHEEFRKQSDRPILKKVVITTDGACIGNPGPGGWAYVLRFGKSVREMYGSEPHTTSNRMELKAIIEALRALKEPCEVLVNTDSEYLKNGIVEWLPKWKANGWTRKAKGLPGRHPVKNQDLWMELDDLVQPHQIRWEWVKGHADHPDNNRCDFLATRAAREQIKKGLGPGTRDSKL